MKMKNLESQHSETEVIINHDEWRKAINCQVIDRQWQLENSDVISGMDNYIYILQLGGRVKAKCEKQAVDLKKQDLLVLHPDATLSLIQVSDDYSAICLILSSKFCHDDLFTRQSLLTSAYSYNMYNEYVLHANKKQANLLEADLRLIISHIDFPGPQTYTALQALCRVFLVDLLSMMDPAQESTKLSKRSYDIFSNFMTLLKRDYREEHSVNYYADKLNITHRYLGMAVKEVSNQSIMFFINEMLIIEACKLLKTTNYNVQEITDKLNFSDPTVFCKFFKRHTGMTPLSYRDSKVKLSELRTFPSLKK